MDYNAKFKINGGKYKSGVEEGDTVSISNLIYRLKSGKDYKAIREKLMDDINESSLIYPKGSDKRLTAYNDNKKEEVIIKYE